ncbi:MAG: PAS domain S-box protein [Gammaproteobacteria bacterium]|nr:PAS domain S-box protein [Gammaproteobacteria bacterium]
MVVVLSAIRTIHWTRHVGVLLAYALSHATLLLFSLWLKPYLAYPSPFWPPLGLLLGVLIIARQRWWLAILVGMFCAELLVGNWWRFGAHTGFNPQGTHAISFIVSVGFSAITIFEAAVAAFCIQRWVAYRLPHIDAKGFLLGLFIVAGVTIPIGAFIGAFIKTSFYPNNDATFFAVWQLWWLSGLLGVLSVTPLVIGAYVLDWSSWRKQTWWYWLEAVLLGVLIVVIDIYVLIVHHKSPTEFLALLPFVVYPLFIWAAMRFRAVYVNTLLLCTLIICVAAVRFEMSPFQKLGDSVYGQLIAQQIYFLVLTLTVVFVRVLSLETKDARVAYSKFANRFRQLLDTAYEMLWATDQQGRLVYVSDAAGVMLGYTPTEMRDHYLDEFMVPEDQARGRQQIRELLVGNIVHANLQVEFVHAKGHRVILSINATSAYEEGVINGVLGTAIDVTEQRLAEHALLESEERFRQVFEEGPIGMYIIDKSLNVVAANKAFCDMLGYNREAVVGVNIRQFSHPDERATITLMSEHFHDAVIQRQRVQRRYIAKNGSEVWGNFSACLIGDAAGKRKFGLGLVENITDRIESEKTRELLEGQIRRLQKLEAVGVLASGIAHDFNNILAGTLGFAELSKTKLAHDHPVQLYLDHIVKSGQRARDLIGQILTFSRGGVSERIKISLREVVQEALQLLRATLPQAVEIQFNDGHEDVSVLADATQLHQVIINLCTNAAQAMGGAGCVIIDLQRVSLNKELATTTALLAAGDYVRLSVKDAGSSIAPDHMDHLFDPFFTTKAAGQGSGLGLSVVHGIVSSHKGGINVISQMGKGTTFQIFFPISYGAAAINTQREEFRQPGRGQRILFVDDEKTLVMLAAELLADLGYDPVVCDSALDAFDIFKKNPEGFDLVITDYSMPKMSGLELAEVISAIRPSQAVILLTGYMDESLSGKTGHYGIAEVAMKPLTASKLSQIIERVLGNAQVLP